MFVRKLPEAGVNRTKIGYRRTRHAKPCKDMRYVCQVCGDVAFGYNFNAITCESCKSFFRRQAQTPNVPLSCANMDNCKITKETRKHCPACRMKKCESLGMSKLRVPSGSYDGNSDDSPSASIDTEQLQHLPLKERYKAARKILDDLEMVSPTVALSKAHLDLIQVVTHCGSQMITPFTVPDAKTYADEPFGLERLMFAQQIERRFVASLNGCPDFAAFTEKERLDILKRSMLNYHNLVSAFYVDIDGGDCRGGWRLPLVASEPLWISRDVIYGLFGKAGVDSELQDFFDAYLNLATSIRKRFGAYWTAVQYTLTLLQLFSPFSQTVPGSFVLCNEFVGTSRDDSATLGRCLPLHYKYANFLQAFCDWLDEPQKRTGSDSSWSFCMNKMVEIQMVNRKFIQSLNLLASSQDHTN